MTKIYFWGHELPPGSAPDDLYVEERLFINNISEFN